jgi:ABC-type sugar transport system ATPase subunit
MIPILEARNISKQFQGTQALHGVDFSLQPGEVHALMGENGAGKSTLSKIFAGAVTPDVGEILINGQQVTIPNPLAAQALGIGIVYQELDLFPHLTVAENIAVGNAAASETSLVRFRSLNVWSDQFLKRVKLDISPNTRLNQLSISQMQQVAIARALSMNARILLLDEPTSSLTEDGVELLFDLISELRSQGVAFIYVSHKMNEVYRIADVITVLRDGKHIGTRQAKELGEDELITMMVGRSVHQRRRSKSQKGSDVLFAVRDLSTEFLSQISFQLHDGEVLGIAGLVGAGRSELGAALFGLRRRTDGTVLLKGKKFEPSSPSEAIICGFSLVPEDRRYQGIFPQMSVRENASIAVLGRWRGRDRVRKEAQSVGEYQEKLCVTASPETLISTLSGGNQQKVILARWLLAEPSVLFLDEPTRGIDIGAKEQIYKLIDELRMQGKGVIFVSSELPELLRCSDRILVLRDGKQTGIVEPAEATQEMILKLAARDEPCSRKLA